MKLSKRKTRRKRKTMKHKKGGTRSSSTRNSRASANRRSASVSRPVAVKSSRTSRLAPIVEHSLRKGTLKRDDNIHVLSGKIFWLLELAGDKHVMTEIGRIWGSDKVKRLVVETTKLPKKGDYKETMYFKDGGKSGHWIYFDKKGQLWNSYDLNHQEQGTNQFCQTFCLLYMIHDHWTKDALYPDWAIQLKSGDYVNNIKVVVSFWKYLFNYEEDFTQMLIDELIDINDEFIEKNKGNTRESSIITLIAKNSDDINVVLINKKLDDIDDYAMEIANIVK